MAVSYTYGDMQNRVADELFGRSDLLTVSANMTTAPIPLAIQTAIKKWEREPFYFNAVRTASAFTTVASQEFYSSADAAWIATVASILKLSILISSNRLYLEPRTPQYMEDVSMNASNTGQPGDYSYYAEKIRLYPVPDGAYPVNALYTQRFAELVSSTDTNAWMSDAEELIRSQAKLILYRDTLLDDAGHQRMQQAVAAAYRDLKAESMRRTGPGRIKPTYF